MSDRKKKQAEGRPGNLEDLSRMNEEPAEKSGESRIAEATGAESPGAAVLDEARREAADNYDKYLRLAAEFDNYRKRVQKDRTDLLNYGNENILKDILPIVDNLERALGHAFETGESGAFIDGVGMILEQLKVVLTKHGVEPVEALGKDFDPHYHEAMLRIDDDGKFRDNQVVEEYEKGYVLNGRLLRPSKVSVAKQKQ